METVPKKVNLEICGLGYFRLYVNGVRVGDEEFVPAVTNYSSVLGCEALYPVWEERSNYRIGYLVYDLLPYLTEGENVIGIHLGNGWYHQTKRTAEGTFLFGFPKLRYELTIFGRDGGKTFIESDSRTLWNRSEVLENNLFCGELQDLRLLKKSWSLPGADQEGWKPALPVHAPETKLEEQICPGDRVIRTIIPKKIGENQNACLYDCGENIAGWVNVKCWGADGEEVLVRHSEELTRDRSRLDFSTAGGEEQIQSDRYICSGEIVEVHPKFCWHGFRYFEITGPAQPKAVSVIHTDAAVTSGFRCSNEVLNWLYDAYIRTQLGNIHGCVPSDCPHRERLGYTGDGRITAEAAMLTLDVKAVYDKWMEDILDSQGADSGHIPHTAPFLGGGGGPGGWGGAVYAIPMAYYKIYGDLSLLKKSYSAIILWLDYMEKHSEYGVVTCEEEGGWCLGDWCTPPGMQPPKLAPEFVNTYFYIKGLMAAQEASFLLGKTEPMHISERLEQAQQSFMSRFFEPGTESFCGGVNGADAFALDIGLGTNRTRDNLINKYRTDRCLDTGIFGTPVLLETLFREGAADLAVDLLVRRTDASFARMMECGATTLWETWDGLASHNHPMFGGVVKLLFTEILGIRQTKAAGFEAYEILPADIPSITWAEGYITTASGRIEVRWERDYQGKQQIR